MATDDGWVTGSPFSTSPPPTWALPTTAQDPLAATRPAASRVTARYSRTEPTGMPETSWKTRKGALSSVPTTLQSVAPRARTRKVVWAKVPAVTSAPTSARPATLVPAATLSATVGAAEPVVIALLAFHTLTESGGTVTVTVPSAAGLAALSVPKTGVKTRPLPEVHVAKLAVCAVVALLAATMYSTLASRS